MRGQDDRLVAELPDGTSPIEALPLELLGMIFDHVTTPSLLACHGVSRRWAAPVESPPKRRAARRLARRQPTRFMALLARKGNLRLVQWARAHGCPWDEMTTYWAAQRGNLPLLAWVHAHGCPLHPRASRIAAGGGHLEVLKWLTALRGGQLLGSGDQGEVVRYRRWFLHRHAEGSQDDMWCAYLAALGGHVPVLEWMLLRYGFYPLWLGNICSNAAEGGHLAALQWARANSCLWNEETCAAAAGGGHLEVLRWAWRHGCPWDATTTAAAARGGHLRVLMWARAQGCPWDSTTRQAAAEAGQAEVLRWVLANGCP